MPATCIRFCNAPVSSVTGRKSRRRDLRLDRRDAAFLGGSGSVIVAGKPEESEILRRIGLPKGHDEIMPALGEPLARRHVQTVRRWIAEGARWPLTLAIGQALGLREACSAGAAEER